ncbi:hypothetical protein [Geobacillus stearothermophilus]|nr:hypothetical protein [Geobacillus stearothermophilus]MDF9297162.1 hypothetical protein [Geobacillus stearothermophilus]
MKLSKGRWTRTDVRNSLCSLGGNLPPTVWFGSDSQTVERVQS